MSKEPRTLLTFLSQVEHSHPGVSYNSLVGLKEYMVCICSPIHTSHMPIAQTE